MTWAERQIAKKRAEARIAGRVRWMQRAMDESTDERAHTYAATLRPEKRIGTPRGPFALWWCMWIAALACALVLCR